MSLKRACFQRQNERFTTYGTKIEAEKGYFISSCKRPFKAYFFVFIFPSLEVAAIFFFILFIPCMRLWESAAFEFRGFCPEHNLVVFEGQ